MQPQIKGGDLDRIIVPVKDGESIEKALKKFKRKFEKTGAIRELRARKTFVKPSVKRRTQIQKAIYVQQMQLQDEQYFIRIFKGCQAMIKSRWRGRLQSKTFYN